MSQHQIDPFVFQQPKYLNNLDRHLHKKAKTVVVMEVAMEVVKIQVTQSQRFVFRRKRMYLPE